jgi:hypothetical protein
MPYPIRTRPRSRLTLQRLEDRRTPATVTWDGGAGTNSWFDAANWSDDKLPVAVDDVVITTGAGVSFNGAAAVASISSTTPFTLAGGSLDVSGVATFGNAFTQTGGTLDGSGTVTLNGPWSWTGGAVQGAGTLALSAGAAGQIDTTTASVKVVDRVVDVAGSLAWVGSLPLQTGDGQFTVVNGGSFDVRGNGRWEFSAGTRAMPITVAVGATMKRTVSAGTAIFDCAVKNNGAVVVDTGILNFNGGGLWTGTATLNAVLCFTTGEFTLADGTAMSGPAPLAVVSGKVIVDPGTAKVAVFDQTGGTVGGPGTLEVTANWAWSGGLVQGAGKLVVAAGAAGKIDTGATLVTLNGRAVESAGVVTWVGANAIATGGAGSVTVKSGGLFDVQGNGNWDEALAGGPAAIVVEAGGTLRRSVGVAVVVVDGPVTNNGVISVASGSLELAGGLTNFSGGTLAGGQYQLVGTLKLPAVNVVTNLAQITLDGPASGLVTPAGFNGLANLAENSGALTLLNGAALTTTGKLDMFGSATVGVGSTLAIGGDVNQVGNIVVNGVLDPAGALLIDAGILSGTGVVAGDVAQNGGAIQPAGFTTGILTITGDLTTAGGLVSVQLNGTTAGAGYDQLDVQGGVTLGGNLGAALGFKAPSPSSFTIIANSGTSDPTVGEFANAAENATLTLSGVRFRINYNAGDGNDVVLTRLPTGVASVVVNDGAAQRSMVRTIAVTFDGKVTLPANPADAFSLERTGPGGGGFVAVTVSTAGSTPAQTVATLTFNGALSENKSLVDGRYTLSVLGAQITDAGGAAVDADNDGTPGGTGVTNLHRLFGDNDGDADVDASDFGAFRATFGTGSNLAFDFDSDGDVDASDFGAFRQRFGLSV